MIAKPASVRLADHRDEDAIYDILIDLHKHNNNGWGFPFRPEIVLKRIEAGTRPDPKTRTDPTDQRRGLIGVIDSPDGKVIGTVGLYLEPPVWFTDAFGVIELWVYVRPEARSQGRLYRDLFKFSEWAHEQLRPPREEYPLDFPLLTGFMHDGDRFEAMERLWRHAGGKKVGVLFMKR